MPERRTTTAPLRSLPSIDALLRTPEASVLCRRVGARVLTALARAVTDELRAEISRRAESDTKTDTKTDRKNAEAKVDGKTADAASSAASDGGLTREALLAEAARRLSLAVERDAAGGLRRVVNATGVVLHTNLGRAPLSDEARRRLAEEAAGYCALEYDAETGARGRRGARVEELLCELTTAEAALVVNNCAAAALLVLTALARGGEAVVSRGELVEIGGDFRVPDVMAESGAKMVEVGTTNRTRLSDYERALTESTRLFMRVHPSNFRVVGFTSAPRLGELAALAREHNLPLYEDAGSGALVDLAPHGLAGEPVIRQSIEAGADLVSFSGDKLLGASQSGLVVGRRGLIDKLRRHPLYRALRADKLALAALEATLEAYRRDAHMSEVPALRMLAAARDEIERRVRLFLRRLQERSDSGPLKFEIIEGRSAVGGGSAPTTHPPTALLALTHTTLSAAALEASLRARRPPVVARVAEGRVVLDLRTVAEREEDELLEALLSIS